MKTSFIRTIAATTGILAMGLGAAAQSPISPVDSVSRDSVNSIVLKARTGDADAQNIVGNWYYTGTYVGKGVSYDDAVQWWLRAAKQGQPLAIGNLGVCYQLGHGVAPDSIRAMKLYDRAIELGNTQLLDQNIALADRGEPVFNTVYVALCYQNGVGKELKKDRDAAIRYFTSAATRNSVDAQRELGLMHLNANNGSEALKWFRKAADKGDLPSTFYVGRLLLEGKGVTADPSQGFVTMMKAARAGFPMALYQIANCYAQGRGTAVNPDEAAKWYKKAAEAGIPAAQYQIAKLYVDGKGVPVDYYQAAVWLGKCSTRGYTRQIIKKYEADNDTAWAAPFRAYLDGLDLMINDKKWEEAAKKFKIVEKAKIPVGATMQALILLDNDNPKKNIKKGIKALEKAASAGEPYAQYLMGVHYETGTDVTRDPMKALELLKAASDLNFAPAQCYLGDLYYDGRNVNQSYETAVKYYLDARAQCQLTREAATRLATCYENGWGVEVDKEQAKALNDASYNDPLPALLATLPNVAPADKKK